MNFCGALFLGYRELVKYLLDGFCIMNLHIY